MSRRLAAGLVFGLALSAAAPAPGLAQRIPPPKLTVTPLTLDVPWTLWGVSFPDPDVGYAVGSYHTIFKTTDGGATWARQQNPLPTRDPGPDRIGVDDPGVLALTAVSFVDPAHGVAVSGSGSVVVTDDGGTTWTARATPAPSTVPVTWPEARPPAAWSFNGVSFTDRDHGYVVGHLGLILATADGGRTWEYRGDPRYGILHDVAFVDPFHGQIVGRNTGRPDAIRYTTLGTNDAGAAWQHNLAATDDDASALNMQGVAVTVPMHAVAVGDAGRVFVTFDEGKTWRIRRSGTTENLHDVAFADRRRGVAVGGINFQGDLRAVLLATNNGGESWTEFPQPDVGYFTSIDFASPTTAFAVGCADTVRNGESGCDAAITKIDFPELDASVEEPVSSGGTRLPLYLLGTAALVAGAGLLVARRR
ncbi:MAG TPA: hypothetical protein VM388_03900 [Acidimicrobiales bacterium]|nr:hypothetical protein [Acidimicrobiales bacterium]